MTVSQGAALEWLQKEYGGLIDVDTSNVVTSSSVDRVVQNDPDALGLVMINLGSNTVFIDIDNNPSATDGLLLNANGGTVSMNVRSDGMLPTRAWYASSPSGASRLFIYRTRRYVKG